MPEILVKQIALNLHVVVSENYTPNECKISENYTPNECKISENYTPNECEISENYTPNECKRLTFELRPPCEGAILHWGIHTKTG